MKWGSLLGLTLVSCVVAVSHSSDARACGGCFHGVDESEPSVVTGHRMALSISTSRTVLWDQIEYSGNPSDFAWVLPVGPGAYIEESTDAWFEALEAVSATHVMSEILVCNGNEIRQQEGGGFGCGGGAGPTSQSRELTAKDGESKRQGAAGSVIVEHEGTVGPYETATLKAGDPMALRDWLTAGGYAVPPEIEPVIDSYVAEGASFIALRLKPGFGTRQMTPVRVVTPGASPILPLRMVAAGTGTTTSIVLYVIAEGRFIPQDKPLANIDLSLLTWDWQTSSSSYVSQRDKALEGGGYLTSFALPKGFTAPVITPVATPALYDVLDTATGIEETFDNLTDLYFGRASSNENIANECEGVGALLRAQQPGDSIATKCEDMAGCPPPPKGTTAAEQLECGTFSDIAAALAGMHPSDVWITRLEANLPRSELASDLTLGADPSQTPVDNWHVAAFSVNPPCVAGQSSAPQAVDDDNDGKGSFGCGCATRNPLGSSAALSGTLLAAILLAIRRAVGRGKRAR